MGFAQALRIVEQEWRDFLVNDKTRRYRVCERRTTMGSQPSSILRFVPNDIGKSRKQRIQSAANILRFHRWDPQREIWLKRNTKDGTDLVVVDEADIFGIILAEYQRRPRTGNNLYKQIARSYAGVPQKYCAKFVELCRNQGLNERRTCEVAYEESRRHPSGLRPTGLQSAESNSNNTHVLMSDMDSDVAGTDEVDSTNYVSTKGMSEMDEIIVEGMYDSNMDHVEDINKGMRNLRIRKLDQKATG